MQSIWSGSSKTLAERAKTRMKRAKKKHQEELLAFSRDIFTEVPDVILEQADLAKTRVEFDMRQSMTFKRKKLGKLFQ